MRQKVVPAVDRQTEEPLMLVKAVLKFLKGASLPFVQACRMHEMDEGPGVLEFLSEHVEELPHTLPMQTLVKVH